MIPQPELTDDELTAIALMCGLAEKHRTAPIAPNLMAANYDIWQPKHFVAAASLRIKAVQILAARRGRLSPPIAPPPAAAQRGVKPMRPFDGEPALPRPKR